MDLIDSEPLSQIGGSKAMFIETVAAQSLSCMCDKILPQKRARVALGDPRGSVRQQGSEGAHVRGPA